MGINWLTAKSFSTNFEKKTKICFVLVAGARKTAAFSYIYNSTSGIKYKREHKENTFPQNKIRPSFLLDNHKRNSIS